MERFIEYFSNRENCAKAEKMSSYMGMVSSAIGIVTSIIKFIKKKHGENISKMLKAVNVICTVLAVSGAAVGSFLVMKMEDDGE